MLRLLTLLIAAAATATTRPAEAPSTDGPTARTTTTTTTTTTAGPHDGRTDGPTPSKALTAPATSAAVSAGPPRTDVAPPGRTRVRMVVSGRDRHTVLRETWASPLPGHRGVKAAVVFPVTIPLVV